MSESVKKGKYDDIIDLPHHVSYRHARMSRIDRAAQFSPFAALTGYEAAVQETARYTDLQIELDENAKELLDSRLRQLCRGDSVTVTWFRPDDRKYGGAYVTVTAPFVRLDPIGRRLVLEDLSVPVTDIYSIE